jgi:hypothetical protein
LSDLTATGATRGALTWSNPERGVVVVVYCDGEEIGCIHAGDVRRRKASKQVVVGGLSEAGQRSG